MGVIAKKKQKGGKLLKKKHVKYLTAKYKSVIIKDIKKGT